MKLTGEANDYIGKGMAGGELVIVPPPGDAADTTRIHPSFSEVHGARAASTPACKPECSHYERNLDLSTFIVATKLLMPALDSLRSDADVRL